MGQYAGVSKWEDNIYQFETTDVVLGGADGVDNMPLKQLADRTTWLKGQVGVTNRYGGVLDVSSSTVLTSDHAGFLIVVNAISKAITLTFTDAFDYPFGSVFHIMSFNTNVSQVTVQTSGRPLIDTDRSRTRIYMGSGEKVKVLVGDGVFYVIEKYGNFETVGEVFYSHKVLPNTLQLTGDLINRVDYPRLWDYAGSLGTILLDDTTRMFTDSLGRRPYAGAFSRGNNTTNYRLPDLRGVVIRALDLGAGLDYGRLWEAPGGYEPDVVGMHRHLQKVPRQAGDVYGDGAEENRYEPGWMLRKNRLFYEDYTDWNDGYGAETRVKNIGLIPLIKA